MTDVHFENTEELLKEAQDFCMNRADMAQYTEDNFITNDYIAIAHMLEHGIQLLAQACASYEGPMVFKELWMPYVELACRILGKKIEGFDVVYRPEQ